MCRRAIDVNSNILHRLLIKQRQNSLRPTAQMPEKHLII